MQRKNLSKMAAAFQACKKLYEMGELAENLLPVLNESDDESETEEEIEPGSDGKKKAKAGTKKRKRVHKRKVFLNISLICFTHVFQRLEQRRFAHCISNKPCCLWAYLCNKPMSDIRRTRGKACKYGHHSMLLN